MTIVGEAFIPVRALTDEWVAKVKGDTSKAAGEAGADVGKIVSTTSAAIAGIAVDAGRSYAAGTNKIIELTGATGEALEDLTGSMRAVGRNSDLESGLDTIGVVIARLNQRLDLTGPVLEERTKQIAQLAEITGGDASQSVTTIIDLFQKWNVPTERQGDLLDYLFAASQKAGVGIDTLIGGVNTGKRALEALGFGLEDSVAFLAQVEAQGGNADKVLAALGTGFTRLAANTKNPEAALERVAGRIRGAATDTEALQIAIEAFGSRSGAVLASVFRGGALDIEGFNAELGDTEGRIDDVRDATITWFDRLGIIRRQLGSFIGPVADELAVVSTIIAGIGPAASGIGAVAKKFGEVRAQVTAVKAAAAAGGETLGTAAASAQVLGRSTGGIALGAGAALFGLGTLVAFLDSRHHAAQVKAREDVNALTQSLRSAAAEGPAAARRIASDLVDEATEAVNTALDTLDKRGETAPAFLGDIRREAVLGSAGIQEMAAEVARLRQEARGLTGERRTQVLAEAEVSRATRQSAISAALYGENSEQAAVQDRVRREAVAALIAAYGEETPASRESAEATRAGGQAAEETARSVRELAQQRRENAAAAREERDAQLAAVGDFLGVQSAVYGARDATRDYREARADVQRLEDKGAQGTEAHADAVMTLRDARLDALQSQLGLKQAAISYADQLKTTGASEAEAIRRIERFGERAGLTKGEVDKLVDSVRGHVRGLDEVPDRKDTRISAPGLDGVKRNVEELDRRVRGLPDTVSLRFVAAGLDTIGAEIAALLAQVGDSTYYGPPTPPSGGGGGGGGGGRRVPAQANQRSATHISIGLNGREVASSIEVSQGENRILFGGRTGG